MKANTSTNPDALNASKLDILGVAMCTSSANMYNILFSMVTYLATGSWGIAVAVAGTIAAAMRIFDGITDPIYTWFLPKLGNKKNVATPQILFGWLLETVSITCLYIFFPQTKSVFLFVLLYAVHIIGYTVTTKASAMMKLLVTTDPKKRPLIARYNQTIIMLFTMVLSLVRSNYLVPKYHGLKGGFFTEMSLLIVIWCTIMIFIGVALTRKFDSAEAFKRNYHGAVDFKLKDIWNLVVHNRAFLMEVISNATDKIASAAASNSATTTMLFGIIIANYKFSGSLSIYTTVVSLVMIWLITGRGQKKGNKTAYLNWCWACCGVAAVTFVFMMLVNPTDISVKPLPTIIFVVLYCLMNSFKSSTGAAVNSLNLDIMDYEFYLHGKYLGPLVSSVGSILAKTVDSFSNIIVASSLIRLGYADTMPQPGDPTSSALFGITMFLWLGMPVLGYIASIIAMKWYPLTAEKMEEVQTHNKELRLANAAKYEAEHTEKAKA